MIKRKKINRRWNRYVIGNGLLGSDDGCLTGGETGDGIDFVGDGGARTEVRLLTVWKKVRHSIMSSNNSND